MDGSPKTLWIIANWKSNKTIKEALVWVNQVGPKLPRRESLKVVVCPDFVSLEEVKKAVKVGNFPILVGAQDLSPFGEGPHTGEEAAKDLSGLADLVILGHSERRKEFGETDQMISDKVALAKSANIIPLVCVQGKDTAIPEGIGLVAYEPIFAIGTGNPDTPQDAQEVASEIKKDHQLEVLYGGSITDQNAKAFTSQDDINGLLIGGASLEAEEFLKIIDTL